MASRGQMPRLLRTVFAAQDLFRCGLVVEKNERGEEVLSETAGLNPNYIRQLLAGAPRTQSDTDPKTLLYLMLRHATLLEHARAGMQVLEEQGLVTKRELYERELVNVTESTPTVFELMDRPVPGVTARATLSEYLADATVRPNTPATRVVDEYRNALLALEALPTAELERLFTETLDVCAYRLDAWVTSLATQRLNSLRKTHAQGLYVGAYGWVEDLKPIPPGERQPVHIDGEENVTASTFNGGYIYAPSMTHGAAAAVLRNAYMTRSGDEQSPYAIDLSSARVRIALWLLDTVREGQLLGASLGYLFERGLHDAGLDRFIEPFRNKYRLAAGPTPEGGVPAESIAARDVVDGYALVQDFRKPGSVHWVGLAVPEAAVQRQVNAVLATVDDALDALTDLLTAESVFQMVGGSTEGTGATLDSMAKGAHPPEPEIARRAHGGTSLTHRVALVLDGDVAALPWPGPQTPRSAAEPRLNSWVARLLGNPANVLCAVRFRNTGTRIVTLADLQLQPLDFLALARHDATSAAMESELDRRIIDVAIALAGAGAVPSSIQYNLPTTGVGALDADQRTFPTMLEVARSINELLKSGRSLQPRDLMLPEEASDAERQGAGQLLPEQQQRADTALARLATVIGELENALPLAAAAPNVAALRTALRYASLFGVAASFPPRTDDGLVTIAQSVLGELRRRSDLAQQAGITAVDRVRAIFGRDFVFLPRFIAARRAELAQVLGASPVLSDDPADPDAADLSISGWLAQAARVRQPLAAWRLVSMYAGTLGRTPPLPRIAQLPFAAGSRWAALPFAPPQSPRPHSGIVSLALLGTVPPADAPWAGVLLDEWVELIPNAAEDAGVVFHYDRPGAEAPQAVLMAVPPAGADGWSIELLLETLMQTFDTVKTRGFDGEWKRSTGEIGHALYDNPWLPLILLAQSDGGTIGSSFGSCVQPDTPT